MANQNTIKAAIRQATKRLQEFPGGRIIFTLASDEGYARGFISEDGTTIDADCLFMSVDIKKYDICGFFIASAGGIVHAEIYKNLLEKQHEGAVAVTQFMQDRIYEHYVATHVRGIPMLFDSEGNLVEAHSEAAEAANTRVAALA